MGIFFRMIDLFYINVDQSEKIIKLYLMILNLKVKRQQLENLYSGNAIKGGQIKSYREDNSVGNRQSREIKSTRINSHTNQRKNGASNLSTITGASSSHNNVTSHFINQSYDNDLECNNKSNEKFDSNRIANAYKKIKKQQSIQKNFVVPLNSYREKSKQRLSVMSQKNAYKKQLLNNIAKNYILVTEPDDHQKERIDKTNNSSLDENIRHLIDPLLLIFGQRSERKSKQKFKIQLNLRSNSTKNIQIKQSLDKKKLSKERQSSNQIFIDDSNYQRYQQATNITEFLQLFYQKLGYIKDYINSQNQNKKSTRQKIQKQQYQKSLSLLLQYIDSFVKQLVQKFSVQIDKKIGYFQETMEEILASYSQRQSEITSYEKELNNEINRNQLLLQKVMELQIKNINSMTVINKLSQKFDLEDYVKQEFNNLSYIYSDNLDAVSYQNQFLDQNRAQLEGQIKNGKTRLKIKQTS